MLFAQIRQKLADLLDDGRLNSFRGLVEQKQPRHRHQRPRQRQDLLLAAGQRPAAALQKPGQPREQRQHALDRPLLGFAGIRRPGEPQIFMRAQTRKNAAALRHIQNSKPAALMRGPTGHIDAVDHDLAAARRQQTHDRLHERGLAHAVVADDTDRFAFPKLQRNAMQHRHFAVAGLQVDDVEDKTVRCGGAIGRVLAHWRIAGFMDAHARFPR